MKNVRKFCKLFLLLLLATASQISCQTSGSVSALPAGPRAFLLPETLKPGEPYVVAVAGYPNAPVRANLVLNGQKTGSGRFFDLGEKSAAKDSVYCAIMAVPSTSGAGSAVLTIETANGVLTEINVTVEARQFPVETIALTAGMQDILTRPDPQKTREAEQLWAILAKTGSDLYSDGNFIMPVNSTFQTSRFGTRRTYKYPNGRSSTSIHAGVDWRAPTGTPLWACAPGKVVLARQRIVTGNTVIIEHMPGVYSLYYHMNKISVLEGNLVETGSPLGEAGATGFATGAHLHWEIRVAAENTDPASFLNGAVLDKEAILARMNQ
ncbi:MAG: M23 family metallopeptidase [Treponema sp.]|jgi:murein DD-endopeptidase MepM/ murein hydrolase activator NlpD|nr:M23 family metallopeptidase [Treponema sp.]